MPKIRNGSKGVSVIELLIVMAIIAIGFSAFFGLTAFSLGTAGLAKDVATANALAREEMEAVIAYRNSIPWDGDDAGDEYDGLGVLTADADYHAATSTGNPARWMLLSDAETLGEFTRKVVFRAVNRDGDKNIAQSGGAEDPNTKEVIVTVSWAADGQSRSVELVTYLTNWRL